MKENHLGYVLERYRLEHGWTREKMAKFLEVNIVLYGRYVNGKTIPRQNIPRICEKLGIPEAELLGKYTISELAYAYDNGRIPEEDFKYGIFLCKYYVRSKEELSMLRNLHKLDKEKQIRAERYIEMLVKG